MRYGAISKRFDTIVEFTAFENFISFEKKCKNKVERVENNKIKITIEVDIDSIFMIFQIGLEYYLIHLRRGKKHKMSKRITLISFIEKNEIKKVEELMSNIKENTCKVPYGINDEKRYEIDNLPYHFTIFATNKENQDEILKIAESINIDKIQLKVNDIKIMNIKHNSYCLYLSIEENQQIMELQRIFYREFPKEKYNPDDFNFHMTLDIDKDYNKVLNLQKTLKENFKSFFLEFNTVALFDYPGDMVKKINLNKNNKK